MPDLDFLLFHAMLPLLHISRSSTASDGMNPVVLRKSCYYRVAREVEDNRTRPKIIELSPRNPLRDCMCSHDGLEAQAQQKRRATCNACLFFCVKVFWGIFTCAACLKKIHFRPPDHWRTVLTRSYILKGYLGCKSILRHLTVIRNYVNALSWTFSTVSKPFKSDTFS